MFPLHQVCLLPQLSVNTSLLHDYCAPSDLLNNNNSLKQQGASILILHTLPTGNLGRNKIQTIKADTFSQNSPL